MPALFDIDFSLLNSNLLFFFVRIMALINTAPIFSEKEVPARVKIGLALLTSFLISPNLPVTPTPVFSFLGAWIIMQQVVIGIAMGFIIQMAFMTVRLSGEVIGMQMGLSFATFFDPSGGPNMPVLARIFNLLALLLFLTFDGHLWLLLAVSESFTILPIAIDPLNGGGFMSLVMLSGQLFINGLKLALPLITLLLLLNMALGLLNRVTPQLSIFVVGFPLTLLLGIILLVFLIPILVPYSEFLFSLFLDNLTLVLDGLVST